MDYTIMEHMAHHILGNYVWDCIVSISCVGSAHGFP